MSKGIGAGSSDRGRLKGGSPLGSVATPPGAPRRYARGRGQIPSVRLILNNIERDVLASFVALVGKERPLHGLAVQVVPVRVHRGDDVDAVGGEGRVRRDPLHPVVVLAVQVQRDGDQGLAISSAVVDDGATESAAGLDELAPAREVARLVVGDVPEDLGLATLGELVGGHLLLGVPVRERVLDLLPAPDDVHGPVLHVRLED
eukprot:CAMPEP_0179300636 /NCGR_PEP_ID=MMETSP0797-20121207/47140_1 /TAXON_ID=47934 /ORGANISM="Dinophysis acuminata, Strain DAEP01" /LENGTH=202 /DNA_ID=CAMNT_0021010119 /DNA_START=48 /DNA_END=657 /DNA_ORIENTATION=+